jgi:hypothetical protein
MEPLFKTVHDAATGETWQEELTDEDLANMPEASDDLAG